MKNKIKQLLEALNEGVFEKEDAIKLSLLTSIAGESIFFLGMPGVAKSLIARRLKFAFKDAKSFEYLMNRFSTPDEIFGPISVMELQNDNYKRIIDNYLPDSEIVFLDEIWKAGPAIQNTLLTVLNERKFRNGKEEIDVNLKGLIAASNELPPDNDGHGDNVDALWDRFIMRLIILNVEDETNFNSMISDDLNPTYDNIDPKLKISDEEYKSWDKIINSIKIPDEVFKVIDVIRKKVQDHNDKLEEGIKQLYISDRRWRKIIRILRTSAFLNERKEVDLMDCFLINDCIWNNENEIDTIEEIVAESIRDYGYSLTVDIESINKQIKELKKEVKIESEYEKTWEETRKKLYLSKFYKLNGLVSRPQWCLLLKEDLAKINNTQQAFYLYDINGANPRNTTMFMNEANIMVADSNWSTCIIETELVPKKEIKTRRPSERLILAWNKVVESIIKEIQNQISIIENHRKNNLEHLHTNLFVDEIHSTIVEENLHNSVHQLQDLKLEVEKTKTTYDELK